MLSLTLNSTSSTNSRLFRKVNNFENMFDKFVFPNEKISNETMDSDLVTWTPLSSPTADCACTASEEYAHGSASRVCVVAL